MTCVREKIPGTFLILVNGGAENKIKLFGFVIDMLVLILTIIQVMLKFINQWVVTELLLIKLKILNLFFILWNENNK
jgi:hypothetical protein